MLPPHICVPCNITYNNPQCLLSQTAGYVAGEAQVKHFGGQVELHPDRERDRSKGRKPSSYRYATRWQSSLINYNCTFKDALQL